MEGDRSPATLSNVSDSSDTYEHLLKVIHPYRTFKKITSRKAILVIAADKTLKIPEDLKTFTEGDNGVHVCFTTKLPLVNSSKQPAIDAVVLVYQVFNRDSLKTIKESIQFIDVRYFVGRCFILVTSETEYCNTDVAEIEQFASTYNLPVHYTSKLKKPDGTQSRLQIPSSLLSVYCPQTGNDVNSLLINAACNRCSLLLKDNPSLSL